jgi:methyl-accepting chemotaxis protein
MGVFVYFLVMLSLQGWSKELLLRVGAATLFMSTALILVLLRLSKRMTVDEPSRSFRQNTIFSVLGLVVLFLVQLVVANFLCDAGPFQLLQLGATALSTGLFFVLLLRCQDFRFGDKLYQELAQGSDFCLIPGKNQLPWLVLSACLILSVDGFLFYLIARYPGSDTQAMGACIAVLVVSIALIIKVHKTFERYLYSITKLIESAAKNGRDIKLSHPERGVVCELLEAVRSMTDGPSRLRGQCIEIGQGLQQGSEKLVDGIKSLHKLNEHSVDVAAQNASSVTQMRTSVQSIAKHVDSLNQLAQDCSGSLFQLEQNVGEVVSSAQNLEGSAGTTASVNSQVTKYMRDVDAKLKEMAMTTEAGQRSIASLSLAISKVDTGISTTFDLSEEMLTIGSVAEGSLKKTVAGINEIKEVTSEAHEVINRLGSQMQAVGRVLTVISDVTKQTNLLALNAAIIAASAGEHGKGFAVVADEIRALADRTATSTKEIGELIDSVQSDSKTAVQAIELGADRVSRGVELVDSADAALLEILEIVGRIGSVSKETQKQTSSYDQLTRQMSSAMNDISTLLAGVQRMTTEHTHSFGGATLSPRLKQDSEFIGRSANEQVQVVSGIVQSMDRISESAGFLGRAMEEQSQGVSHVARIADKMRDAVSHEESQWVDVKKEVGRVGQMAQRLAALVDPSSLGDL